MKILHLSMECYPVAKVGGLADVVGALPKYQNKMEDIEAEVVIPWYNKPFVHEHQFEEVFSGYIHQGSHTLPIQVLKETEKTLGFNLYLVKIPGLLDRDNPYGYADESYQFMAFQQAVLHWLCAEEILPDILHCHDYHTGLVPFFIQNCSEFRFLKEVKTIGTIHNGEYQGQMPWNMAENMPWYDHSKWGLLDWSGVINPLASLLKCCNAFNAVSEGYLQELFHHFKGLENLVQQEKDKAFGIINGIDTEVWNPETDPFLKFHYNEKTVLKGKKQNKKKLCKDYGLNPDLPLFAFIGRFAGEKGADLLPEIVSKSIQRTFGGVNVIILGSGDSGIENRLLELNHVFANFALDLGYKEYLSHEIYASADFLIMPSRVEPCGLNQMYAMRYGTMPIVRYTGGLRDTVQDVSTGGAGLNFGDATSEDVVNAMFRALHLYENKDVMETLIKNNMKFDFSWEKSAKNYINLYKR